MTSPGLPIRTRIELHIISKNNCWITNYKVDSKGRPKITINKRRYMLSRIVYELYKGESPGDLCVCHRCDNPLCINPEHLFLGTHLENMLDCKRKNRQAKGSDIGTSKLTESQVLEIKELLIERRLNYRRIGEKFGVSRKLISLINTGKLWGHLEGMGGKISKGGSGKKLDTEKVKQIKKLLTEGMSNTKIAKLFGVSQMTISSIRHNKMWANVKLDITPFQLKIPGLEQFFKN